VADSIHLWFFMIQLLRTDASDPDFIVLVSALDMDLSIRDGDDHAFYAQFNKVTFIKHVVVAYLNGSSVGCGAIKEYETGVAEVKRMFVPQALRRQGIASQVLAGLETWAHELGYRKCILETGTQQPEAISLYKKNGYGIIPNYGQYAGIENSVCFEKDLEKL
jgi:putative acetyltransferase